MHVIEQIWNAFNDIHFVDETHTYTNSLGTKFTSATGYIEQFVPKTDWDAKAANSVGKPKYKGLSAKEIKALWKMSGDYAKTLGTEVHAVMENLWRNKDYAGNTAKMQVFPGMINDFANRKRACKKLFEKMKRTYIPIANELIVYDVDNALCGTIDFLAYNKVTNTYAIIDWKTSKEFNYNSFDSSNLLAPFEQFDAANVNEYSIQLSLYAWILEKHTDIKISEMILFQIPANGVINSVKCNDMRPFLNTILK